MAARRCSIPIGKAPQGLIRDGPEQRLYRNPEHGVAPSRGDIGQRTQNEGPLMHPGMGQDGVGPVPDQCAHRDQIEIQAARGIRLSSLSAEARFDRQQVAQQGAWISLTCER